MPARFQTAPAANSGTRFQCIPSALIVGLNRGLSRRLLQLVARGIWRGSNLLGAVGLAVGLLGGIPPSSAAEPPFALPEALANHPGRKIYDAKCASCHGRYGEGVATEYSQALVGDRSRAEVEKLVVETMPKGEPQACVGPEAKLVSQYLYDAFYGPEAQFRIHPPRVELARLTVRQTRESITDLVGSFRPVNGVSKERGLDAEYFKSRKMIKEERVLERRDPLVNFRFAKETPDREKLGDEDFSARWRGSLYAPETGDYEFVVHCTNAFRLWINDNNRALIDAGVKSGDDSEFRAALKLTGGRWYNIRLEYFRTKKEPAATVALHWQRPGRVEEPIPERYLSPQRVGEVFVLATPFPPDDRSTGYERATSVSKAWAQATSAAAIETAQYITARINEFAGTKENAGDRAEKLKQFARTFVSRAFRQPLDEELAKLYVEPHFADAADPDAAVRRVILLALSSPRFLYREPQGDNSPHVLAARLSFTLWDTLPDQRLMETAAKGGLKTPQQVREYAWRMASDPRANLKLNEFLLHWLRVDHLTDVAKDRERFAEFTPEVVSDLRESLALFLADCLAQEQPDFRQLLTAESVYLSPRLAKFYGVTDEVADGFRPVALDPGQRAGVLTHPFLLAGFAYSQTSSPIHRGVFVARSVLGRSLKPPPEAVAPIPPDLHAEMTTRERVIMQTKPEACNSCHMLINPLGFTLEHFDAVGRYRESEQGKPIDASGSYFSRHGKVERFRGARELAAYLVSSDEVAQAFAEQMFHEFVKQPLKAYGYRKPEDLRDSFRNGEYNLRRLMVDIATIAAWSPTAPETAANSP